MASAFRRNPLLTADLCPTRFSFRKHNRMCMCKHQQTNAGGPVSSPPFSDPGSYPRRHSSSCHLVWAPTTHNPQAPPSWAGARPGLSICPFGPFLSKVDPHHHSAFVVYKALVCRSPPFICPLPQRGAGSGVLQPAAVGLGEPIVSISSQLHVQRNQPELAVVEVFSHRN